MFLLTLLCGLFLCFLGNFIFFFFFVIVALVGTRYLGEKDMKRRVFAACIVVAGLGVLIAGR